MIAEMCECSIIRRSYLSDKASYPGGISYWSMEAQDWDRVGYRRLADCGECGKARAGS